MPEFAYQNGHIYYEDLTPTPGASSPAAPVILVHNFMSTGRTAWDHIANELSQEYRVILPDLPGHGRSKGYPEGFDHRQMAHWLAALLAELEIRRAHLAGCSAGGAVAAWMVQDGLVEVASLALISATYSTNPATTGIAPDMRPEAFRFGRNWLAATAKLHDDHHGQEYFDETILPAFRALTPATTIDLKQDDLAAWRFPVDIIHGEEDEIFPVGLAEQMHAALPNSDLHIIPGQSHSLIFRRPQQISQLLCDFLADISAQSK